MPVFELGCQNANSTGSGWILLSTAAQLFESHVKCMFLMLWFTVLWQQYIIPHLFEAGHKTLFICVSDYDNGDRGNTSYKLCFHIWNGPWPPDICTRIHHAVILSHVQSTDSELYKKSQSLWEQWQMYGFIIQSSFVTAVSLQIVSPLDHLHIQDITFIPVTKSNIKTEYTHWQY